MQSLKQANSKLHYELYCRMVLDQPPKVQIDDMERFLLDQKKQYIFEPFERLAIEPY